MTDEYPTREDVAEAQQRAAAGPQPTRERDTDAWWAD